MACEAGGGGGEAGGGRGERRGREIAIDQGAGREGTGDHSGGRAGPLEGGHEVGREGGGHRGAGLGNFGQGRGLLVDRPFEGDQRAGLEGQGGDVNLVDAGRSGQGRGVAVGVTGGLGLGRCAALEEAEAPAFGRAAIRVVVGGGRPLEAAIGCGTKIGDVVATGTEADEGGILDESREGHR